MRPGEKHHVTTSLGYGKTALPFRDAARPGPAGVAAQPVLEQASMSVVDSWQAFQPLLIVYGVDYSRFVGAIGKNRESLLPRFAIQYSPATSTRLKAAVTPGRNFPQNPDEGLNTENISAAESASTTSVGSAPPEPAKT